MGTCCNSQNQGTTVENEANIINLLEPEVPIVELAQRALEENDNSGDNNELHNDDNIENNEDDKLYFQKVEYLRSNKDFINVYELIIIGVV